MGKGNIGMGATVKCEGCGKIGDDRDVPTIQFPNGEYRTLCKDCFKKATEKK